MATTTTANKINNYKNHHHFYSSTCTTDRWNTHLCYVFLHLRRRHTLCHGDNAKDAWQENLLWECMCACACVYVCPFSVCVCEHPINSLTGALKLSCRSNTRVTWSAYAHSHAHMHAHRIWQYTAYRCALFHAANQRPVAHRLREQHILSTRLESLFFFCFFLFFSSFFLFSSQSFETLPTDKLFMPSVRRCQQELWMKRNKEKRWGHGRRRGVFCFCFLFFCSLKEEYQCAQPLAHAPTLISHTHMMLERPALQAWLQATVATLSKHSVDFRLISSL